MDKLTVNIKTDTSELDATIKKAQRLRDLLVEADHLIEELASKEVVIPIRATTE